MSLINIQSNIWYYKWSKYYRAYLVDSSIYADTLSEITKITTKYWIVFEIGIYPIPMDWLGNINIGQP